MLDWNHDGKIDYKDHAFFENVVCREEKKKQGDSPKGNCGQDSSCGEENSSWLKWVFIFLGAAIICGL